MVLVWPVGRHRGPFVGLSGVVHLHGVLECGLVCRLYNGQLYPGSCGGRNLVYCL